MAKYINGTRVVLSTDHSIRGRVVSDGGQNTLSVRWDNFDKDYLYLEESIIPEKDISLAEKAIDKMKEIFK